MTEAQKFSEAIWKYQRLEYAFKEALEELGFEEGEHYANIGWDEYDNSIEIYNVKEDARLNEAQQRVIFDAGFSIAYVNHKDGWETHYRWDYREPFKRCRGWRRRYVSDPGATTTNVIAGKSNPGYYEISYWPESWGGRAEKWKDDGYMRVVPDPLDPGPL